MKEILENELLLYPCPVVLVTSKLKSIENVLTVSWTGIASSHPEYVTIAINPKRYSHKIIKQSGCFCINIPNVSLLNETDYCGSYSGREINKFDKCGFHKTYKENFILIDECPMNILCDVKSIIELGSHDLFIAAVREKYTDYHVTKSIHDALDPIAYFRPYYYKLEKQHLQEYGFQKQQANE